MLIKRIKKEHLSKFPGQSAYLWGAFENSIRVNYSQLRVVQENEVNCTTMIRKRRVTIISELTLVTRKKVVG